MTCFQHLFVPESSRQAFQPFLISHPCVATTRNQDHSARFRVLSSVSLESLKNAASIVAEDIRLGLAGSLRVATTRAQAHPDSSRDCPVQSEISTARGLIVQNTLRFVLITSPCVGTTREFCSSGLFAVISLAGLESSTGNSRYHHRNHNLACSDCLPCVATTHAQVHWACYGYCSGQSGISTDCGPIVQDTLRLVLITSPCVGTTRDFALPG